MKHPCGALPSRSFSALVTWCVPHQAYLLQLGSWSQHGDDVTDARHLTVEFGPFDGPADVRAALVEWAYEVILIDGLHPLPIFRMEAQGDEGQADEAPSEECEGQEEQPLLQPGHDY